MASAEINWIQSAASYLKLTSLFSAVMLLFWDGTSIYLKISSKNVPIWLHVCMSVAVVYVLQALDQTSDQPTATESSCQGGLSLWVVLNGPKTAWVQKWVWVLSIFRISFLYLIWEDSEGWLLHVGQKVSIWSHVDREPYATCLRWPLNGFLVAFFFKNIFFSKTFFFLFLQK